MLHFVHFSIPFTKPGSGVLLLKKCIQFQRIYKCTHTRPVFKAVQTTSTSLASINCTDSLIEILLVSLLHNFWVDFISRKQLVLLLIGNVGQESGASFIGMWIRF